MKRMARYTNCQDKSGSGSGASSSAAAAGASSSSGAAAAATASSEYYVRGSKKGVALTDTNGHHHSHHHGHHHGHRNGNGVYGNGSAAAATSSSNGWKISRVFVEHDEALINRKMPKELLLRQGYNRN